MRIFTERPTTDLEFSSKGEKFINTRKKILSEIAESSGVFWDARSWDFLDPIRVGIYITVAGKDGPFAIDDAHLLAVCTNTAAFISPQPEGSLPISSLLEKEDPT